jgi:glycosyltransferase involved in cell wall biosynthesis
MSDIPHGPSQPLGWRTPPDVSPLPPTASGPHVLCIGGEDHHLRIPFLLALRDQGFQVTAAASCDAAPFRQANIPYHAFQFDRFVNPLADRRTIGALQSLLTQVLPDIVQTFDTKPNVLVPLATRGMRGVRVVRTINGMGWVYSSSSPVALALRVVQRVLHRRAAHAVAATVFQNREDKQFFERHAMVELKHSHLIPGSGVDIDKFDRDLAHGPSPSFLRESLGLGTADVVVTVTRLTRQKGIPTLLKAAAIVHRARPSVRFLLVGPRDTEGRLAVSQAEIDRHAPYVAAIGPRKDVPALLRLADVFAFPTEYREGVPRVLLEAGLAGVPIVTTKMPGCSDVIRDAWNGFLVPPRAPRLLAERILDLLDNRAAARTMAERATADVRRGFGLDLTVARYRALYERLLERPAQPGVAPLAGTGLRNPELVS